MIPGVVRTLVRVQIQVIDELRAGADVWREIETGTPDRSGFYVLGLDLGEAAAAFWPDAGGLDTFAAFPERPDLYERG